jgi:hypothetical protein
VKEVFCLQGDKFGKGTYDTRVGAIRAARYNHTMGVFECEVWRATVVVEGKGSYYRLIEKVWPSEEIS